MPTRPTHSGRRAPLPTLRPALRSALLPGLLALGLAALPVVAAPAPVLASTPASATLTSTVPLSAAPLSAAQVQAARGETVYVLACAMCHGDRLEGISGPALRGESFEAGFADLPPLGLHDLIRDTMPQDQRGTLSPQEVLDVTAYLLGENGHALPDGGLNAANLSGLLPRRQDTPTHP
ncbi:c-type cytochrome [Deinococcus seoulensis]|uniref:c-type cytochrome n=1 Tax=Deinococcus seoulensis TaxID=1837379 RepID=UPI00166F0F8A|nr:cytochrome c [Deinococcus seoulensis]